MKILNDNSSHGRTHCGTWGQWSPQVFLFFIYFIIFLILLYLGINFSNFFSIKLHFAPFNNIIDFFKSNAIITNFSIIFFINC